MHNLSYIIYTMTELFINALEKMLDDPIYKLHNVKYLSDDQIFKFFTPMFDSYIQYIQKHIHEPNMITLCIKLIYIFNNRIDVHSVINELKNIHITHEQIILLLKYPSVNTIDIFKQNKIILNFEQVEEISQFLILKLDKCKCFYNSCSDAIDEIIDVLFDLFLNNCIVISEKTQSCLINIITNLDKKEYKPENVNKFENLILYLCDKKCIFYQIYMDFYFRFNHQRLCIVETLVLCGCIISTDNLNSLLFNCTKYENEIAELITYIIDKQNIIPSCEIINELVYDAYYAVLKILANCKTKIFFSENQIDHLIELNANYLDDLIETIINNNNKISFHNFKNLIYYKKKLKTCNKINLILAKHEKEKFTKFINEKKSYKYYLKFLN